MKKLARKLPLELMLGIVTALMMPAMAWGQSSSAAPAKTAAKPAAAGTKTTAAKPAAGKSGVVQYKDPEDQQTRYRPGNNKTSVAANPSTTKAGAATAPAAGAAKTDAAAQAKEKPVPRKHVSNIKWSNRTAGTSGATTGSGSTGAAGGSGSATNKPKPKPTTAATGPAPGK